jgi:uncharacterized RDD family membrane protein YckC
MASKRRRLSRKAGKAKQAFAPLPRRLAAFALETLVILAYILVVTLLSFAIYFLLPGEGLPLAAIGNPWVSDLLTFSFIVLPVILYFSAGESSSRGATWGKRNRGLQVVDVRGERLPFARAFLRNLIKFLPWQLSHTAIYHIEGWPVSMQEPSPVIYAIFAVVWLLVGAYIVMPIRTPERTTPYDWLSGARVINRE